MGPNGPVAITVSDMNAYGHLSGRDEAIYRQQILRFIPVLDRTYLKDFYDRQNAEYEKLRKKKAKGKS